MSSPYIYPVTCVRCGNRFNPDLQMEEYMTESGERLCSKECLDDEWEEMKPEPRPKPPGIDDLTERDE